MSSQREKLVFIKKFIPPQLGPLLAILSIRMLTVVHATDPHDSKGPEFVIEPSHRLEFMNRAGARLDCVATGNPPPSIEWLDQENTPLSPIQKIRHILSNGSLYFPPFEAEAFRQDVHWANYKCISSNSVGTIVSRDVSVKAVVNQRYEPEVQNPGGFLGGNVLIRCNIPPFVRDYVKVTSWLQEPSFNIYPTLEGDGKYHMLPSGELFVSNVTRIDAQKSYRCRTHHQLTQEAIVSANAGRIQLSEMRESVPPIMNEKVIHISVKLEEALIIPCVAYANPRPSYRWHLKRSGRDESLDGLLGAGRATIRDGTLTIHSIKEQDSGSYYCTATNSEGSEKMEVQVSISAPLDVHIQPANQVIDLNKEAHLVCTVSGTPQASIVWLKDGQPLRTGSRVRLVSKTQIKITSLNKDDRGMYQCFVKNDFDSAQGTAELKLGEMTPQLLYKFIEQTMQPGPSVSLKCSASGNPTPQIIWTLDGFPLPHNDRLLIGQYVTIFGDVISHVNITAVKSEDGGEYECTAKSKAGSVTHSARLNVYVPPKITPFTFAKDLNVNDRTSIQCVVTTGDLPLNFTWLKDGLPLRITSTSTTSSAGVSIRQNDDFTSALSITNIMVADAGSYTCRVQNDAATVEHVTPLSVNVPPRIPPFSFDNDITEGMRTQLMCTSSQGDQPLNITWSKDDRQLSQQLEDKTTIDINDYAVFSSILTIHNVTSAHNGNYTCQITNRAGTVAYTAPLSVSVPPRWIVEPADQSAVLGHQVVITCQADGFPQPSVVWKQAIGEQTGEYRELSFAGGSASSSGPLQTFSNGTMFIPNVTRHNQGDYLCQTNNGIGAGLSKLIRLTVHVGPQVLLRNKQISVRRGETINLHCEADGDKPLTVTWRAKGQRIDSTYDVRYQINTNPLNKGISSELTISQTTLSDRGEYSCIATNAFGTDHSTVHLQVQEPPSFPRNLHVTQLKADSVHLMWTAGDQDSSAFQPVSNYIVQYKEAEDTWRNNNHKKVVPGDKTDAFIDSLKPATNYHFRIYAENHLGTSAASDILNVQTEAKIPSSPPQQVSVEPLGRQQLLVTWRPPEHSTWNGELLGYMIGLRRISSGPLTAATAASEIGSTNYTRVGIPGGEIVNDFRITDLEKYTQYSITVAAFNIKGDGPASEAVIARTLEDVPSQPPQSISCVALTAQSIQISWKPPPDDAAHGIIQGFKILYEPSNTESDHNSRETKVTSAMNTVLYGLLPYTNFSVQVLAFTRAGEGAVSAAITCTTEEAVPDAPERIKAVTKSDSSVIISWLPPRRPNGVVTKYTVFVRVLENGQEVKILKDVLLAQNRHYEANDLSSHETYEAWVAASTRIGQGPSTSVVKLVPSASVPASIVSFGQTLSVAWRVDVKLQCLTVGQPKPTFDWRVQDARGNPKATRLESNKNDFSLTLRNVQRNHQGNYTCHVKNPLGSDFIVYQLFVLVPPAPPELEISSSTTSSINMQWRVGDTGGASVRGFMLSYRREFGDWEEILLDRRMDSHMLENLLCGTGYQFTISAFNRIGSGNPSNIEMARTKGNKPQPPRKQHFIRANITSVSLELSAWQDGGCPILYFTVEYQKVSYSSEWILVSSNVGTHRRFVTSDLEPATGYSVRVTGHNNAGDAPAEYPFETLSSSGTVISLSSGEETVRSEETIVLMDSHLIVICIISIMAAVVAVLGVFFCLRTNNREILGHNDSISVHLENNKYSTGEHRDHHPQQQQQQQQHYATNRKMKSDNSHSPDNSILDRIPEYSEDIYPYATFHLPDHENMAGNPGRPSVAFPKTIRASANTNNTNTTGRRKSKPFKSESEEYDSLGSDTDTGSADHGGHHLDEPVNFSGRSFSPGPRKEKLALFQKPTRHNGNHRPFINSSNQHHHSNEDTSKETLPISEAVNSSSSGRPSSTSYHNRTPSYQSNYEHLKLASSTSTPLKFNGSNKFSLITSEFLTLTPRRKGQILEKWHLEFQDQNNNNHFIPIPHQQHHIQKHGRSASGGGVGNGSGSGGTGGTPPNTNTLGFGNDELCNSATLKLGSDLIYSRNKYPSSDLNALKFAIPQSSAISIDNNNGSIKSSLSPATTNEGQGNGGVATVVRQEQQQGQQPNRKGFRAPSSSRDFTIAV